MEEHGVQQEGDEEEPSNPESLEDDLSEIHLSDADPLAQKKRKRRRQKKKPKTDNNAGNNTFAAPASASGPSQVPAHQEGPPSSATSGMNPKPATNAFTEEARLATCNSIIEATQRKILNLRRGQFDDIYIEFKQLCEISWSITKGEMSRLLIGYRDPARVITLHKCISEFPSGIPAAGLPKTIEILTKSVQEFLLIFPDVIAAFSRYEHPNPSERVLARRSTDMMRKFYTAKDAEWKRFDVQVDDLESTISRFEKEMELIKQGKKWTTDAQKEMLKTEKEKTEKVVKEMMKKEREKCDDIGCSCVEKERLTNLLVPGLGTKARDDVDRKKIVEILTRNEPWKEHDTEKLFEDFKKRHFGSDGRPRTRES